MPGYSQGTPAKDGTSGSLQIGPAEQCTHTHTHHLYHHYLHLQGRLMALCPLLPTRLLSCPAPPAVCMMPPLEWGALLSPGPGTPMSSQWAFGTMDGGMMLYFSFTPIS